MSWGSYAYLSDSIELAQAATVKICGGTVVMISGQFALTAAHVFPMTTVRIIFGVK